MDSVGSSAVGVRMAREALADKARRLRYQEDHSEVALPPIEAEQFHLFLSQEAQAILMIVPNKRLNIALCIPIYALCAYRLFALTNVIKDLFFEVYDLMPKKRDYDFEDFIRKYRCLAFDTPALLAEALPRAEVCAGLPQRAGEAAPLRARVVREHLLEEDCVVLIVGGELGLLAQLAVDDRVVLEAEDHASGVLLDVGQ